MVVPLSLHNPERAFLCTMVVPMFPHKNELQANQVSLCTWQFNSTSTVPFFLMSSVHVSLLTESMGNPKQKNKYENSVVMIDCLVRGEINETKL